MLFPAEAEVHEAIRVHELTKLLPHFVSCRFYQTPLSFAESEQELTDPFQTEVLWFQKCSWSKDICNEGRNLLV